MLIKITKTQISVSIQQNSSAMVTDVKKVCIWKRDIVKNATVYCIEVSKE